MAMKRKFADDSESASCPTSAKQLKLVPWPNYQPDEDSCMSEADPIAYHTRFPSNVSTASSNLDSPSATATSYPAFNLYPLPFFGPDGSVNTNSHSFAHYSARQTPSPPVGLLQPSSSFSHHGSSCSQIPKLKVACAPGVNGQRTMWSYCEQCGAIDMVDDRSS
ncbi:hypothetical protein R3P38DRAFT_2840801 [Favolaschia claudopus]|uniref:Uncharacterized protein n=1 Tax=Favolaschia claudopus TaxID=2862362 RepID=A0AAW0DX17_9AGAR